MKLTNMKLDKSDREETKAADMPIDAPVYPWGLQVRLDEKAIDKLGIAKLPKVDGELMLVARVRVTGVQSNEHSTGGEKTHKHKSIELQITDLALDDVPAEKSEAQTLYGD